MFLSVMCQLDTGGVCFVMQGAFSTLNSTLLIPGTAHSMKGSTFRGYFPRAAKGAFNRRGSFTVLGSNRGHPSSGPGKWWGNATLLCHHHVGQPRCISRHPPRNSPISHPCTKTRSRYHKDPGGRRGASSTTENRPKTKLQNKAGSRSNTPRAQKTTETDPEFFTREFSIHPSHSPG